jgi:hypothetical protein
MNHFSGILLMLLDLSHSVLLSELNGSAPLKTDRRWPAVRV